MSQNRFLSAAGDGLFRTASLAVPYGTPLSDSGGLQAAPYMDGRSFAGLAASASAAGAAVGVLTSADNLQNVPKANPSQTIAQGQPVFATAGGVAGGLAATGAIGTARIASPAGAASITLDLDPGMKGGSPGAATGLTAAGSNQATATAVTSETNQFTNVPAGSGTMLAIVQVGATITIFNDGANGLRVYPPSGAAIGDAGINAPVTVQPGSSASFHRIGLNLWH